MVSGVGPLSTLGLSPALRIRLPATSDPAAVTGAWDTVISWDLALPSRQVGYPWSALELGELRAYGVELPEVVERLHARSRGWLRPVVNAGRRLVLVVHENEKGHHPIWTQIENCFEGLSGLCRKSGRGTGMMIRRLEELRIEAPDAQPDQCHLHPVDRPSSFVDEVPAPAQAREMEAAE